MAIFEIHAAHFAVLANAKRLAIMACLDCRELSVGELAAALECPLSTISRHLSVLKNKNLVLSRKEGTTVFYRPSDQRIIEACTAIRNVLVENMQERGVLAREIDLDNLIV